MDVVVEVSDDGVPRLRFTERYNAAEYFVDRHIAEGRGNKAAIRTLQQEITYAELADNVNRFGNAVASPGVKPGDRLLMAVVKSTLADSPARAQFADKQDGFTH